MRASWVLVLLSVLSCCQALSCPCWSQTPRNCVDPTDCKGGLTSDACGCCQRCAKVLNERCGGPWNAGGVCDAGLACNKNPDDFNASGICVEAATNTTTTTTNTTTSQPETLPSS